MDQLEDWRFVEPLHFFSNKLVLEGVPRGFDEVVVMGLIGLFVIPTHMLEDIVTGCSLLITILQNQCSCQQMFEFSVQFSFQSKKNNGLTSFQTFRLALVSLAFVDRSWDRSIVLIVLISLMVIFPRETYPEEK